MRIGGRVSLSPDGHRSSIGAERSAQDLHQRALARAIFTNQGMDSPRRNGKADVIKSLGRAKSLRDSLHRETDTVRILLLIGGIICHGSLITSELASVEIGTSSSR